MLCRPLVNLNRIQVKAIAVTIVLYSIVYTVIDLFTLHVLFSHYRPCDVTPGNCFFQMSRFPRAMRA